jgi:predicted nucleic acid-binding protein
MNGRRGLVLDANILIRAVFGRRVREILEFYENVASFCSPDVCFQDARKYIPDFSERRAVDAAIGLTVLEEVGRIVEPVDRSLYEDFENIARERVLARDPDDWPIVGRFNPRFADWTEDQDFFGSGVATWTTDRVELYLRES